MIKATCLIWGPVSKPHLAEYPHLMTRAHNITHEGIEHILTVKSFPNIIFRFYDK